MTTTAALDASPWPARKARAKELAARWPFASEVLTFYAALLEVQEQAFESARSDAPHAERLIEYVFERGMPSVIEVSVAYGPAALVQGVLERFADADLKDAVRSWLCAGGVALRSVDRFLARAAAGPVLEALGKEASGVCGGTPDERHCPVCAGPPQLGYLAASAEDLVTGHRHLQCARCAQTWAYPRMVCAACGENDSAKLLVYAETGTTQAERAAAGASGNTVVKPGTAQESVPGTARFPHMRIDACGTCSHYLLTVDVARDGRAVPLVDEVAALPLNMYAKELGLTKVVPNLMGF